MLTCIESRDTIENIGRLEPAVAEVACEEILGVVVYNLPGRDCHALASNGELPVGSIARYRAEYIDGMPATLGETFVRSAC